jgi:hypothetical protein
MLLVRIRSRGTRWKGEDKLSGDHSRGQLVFYARQDQRC